MKSMIIKSGICLTLHQKNPILAHGVARGIFGTNEQLQNKKLYENSDQYLPALHQKKPILAHGVARGYIGIISNNNRVCINALHQKKHILAHGVMQGMNNKRTTDNIRFVIFHLDEFCFGVGLFFVVIVVFKNIIQI